MQKVEGSSPFSRLRKGPQKRAFFLLELRRIPTEAERLVRTMRAECAYGTIYASSTEPTAVRSGWLFRCNHHRNHSAPGRKPPTAGLTELRATTRSGPTAGARTSGPQSCHGAAPAAIGAASRGRR
jgi:hypothetical protein